MSQQLSGESFLAVVSKSGLVEPTRLQQYVENFSGEGGDAQNAAQLADFLVEKLAITRWQAEKLLQGKHKGYFLGKYRLLSLLGRGGMSSVYLADHVLMRRRCAIKVLPAKRVGDSSYLGRFHREAQAVASLDHPNIVRAYDVDHQSDRDAEIHFLVMEYVEGSSLQELVAKQGPVAYADAIDYVRQSALGLAHAHKAGLVHRDIKPGNLLLDKNGTVKILDLGLARFFNGSDEEQALTIQHDEKVLGTADYLAPEQALDSHSVDARADIYALGCTLFFLLTGQPPFTEGTLTQRLMAHQTKEPPPLTQFRPDAPDSLVELLKRMMAKKPDDRFPSAADTAMALLQWLNQNADPAWRQAHVGIFSGLPDGGVKRATVVAAKVVSPAKTATPVAAKVVAQPAAPATQPSTPVTTAAAPVAPPPAPAVAEPEPELTAFFAGLSTNSAPAAPTTPASSIHTGTGSSKIQGAAGKSSLKARSGGSSKSKPLSAKLTPAPPAVVPEPPAPPATPAVSAPSPAPVGGLDFSFLNAAEAPPEFVASAEPPPVKPEAFPEIVLEPPVADPEASHEFEATVMDVATAPEAPAAPSSSPFDLQPFDSEPETEPLPSVEVAVQSVPVTPTPTPVPEAAQTEITSPVEEVVPAFPTFEASESTESGFPAGGFGFDTGVSVSAARTSRKAVAKPATPAASSPKGKGIPKSWVLMGGGAVVLMTGVVLAGNLLGWFGSAKKPSKPAPAAANDSATATDTASVVTTAGGTTGNTRKSTAASDPSWSRKRETTVGPGAEFPTISAALQQVSRNFSSQNRSDRFVIKVAAGTYTDRFAINAKDFDSRAHSVNVAIRGEGEVILQPQGGDPVIRLTNATGIQLQNLKVRASGPVAIEIAESVDRSQLQNIEIEGFSDAGILLSGALGPSFTTDRLTLEDIRFKGQSSAVGVRGQKGRLADSVDCQNIYLHRCKFLGPLAAGAALSGADTRAWEFRECIFYQTQVGVDFSAPVNWSDFVFLNNTFYQCPVGVRVAQQPPTSSKGISFRRNLFVGVTQAEVVIADKFDAKGLIDAQMLGLIQGNWTDRAAPATPATGELGIWGAGSQGQTGIAFESTDASAPRFLAPTATAPQRSQAGARPGEPAWIGAVGP